MENNGKAVVWTIGAQMIALSVGLIMVALIVFIASKAWKKGQNNYCGVSGRCGGESNYGGGGDNWLNY